MQVARELEELRCPNVFLFTADEDVKQHHAQEIAKHNIHLVVWDAIKRTMFASHPLIVGYTEWATTRLHALQHFWTQASSRHLEGD